MLVDGYTNGDHQDDLSVNFSFVIACHSAKSTCNFKLTLHGMEGIFNYY